MGAIALVGAVGFTACSSDDDLTAPQNPTFDGESVKTQFAISIPYAGKGTRLTEDIVQGQNKPETRVKINLTAYDIATGASLANKIGECGPFYTDDIAKLSMKAISSIADDFLNTIQTKFTEMAENGRSIMMYITFDANSAFTMESEVGNDGLTLQDEIELWIDANSYNNNYHLQGVSPLNMVFDDIRLPFVDENGATYTVGKYSTAVLKFFRSLGISISRSLKGNTLYITIK